MPKKSKTETKKNNKKEEVESFNLDEAIKDIRNPYLQDGFKNFISNYDIKDSKTFNELLQQFIGGN